MAHDLARVWKTIRTPETGQTCGEDCGKTGCALTAEDCVEGLCEPTAGNVCGKLGENGIPSSTGEHNVICARPLCTCSGGS